MNESLSILPNDLVHAHKIALSQFTFARIGLEKVGTSISMKEVLKFCCIRKWFMTLGATFLQRFSNLKIFTNTRNNGFFFKTLEMTSLERCII